MEAFHSSQTAPEMRCIVSLLVTCSTHYVIHISNLESQAVAVLIDE